MRKRYTTISLLILVISGLPALADTYVRQPSVDVQHYGISIQISDSSNSITGTTKIQVSIRSDTATGMWLDFEGMTVDRVLAGGMAGSFKRHDDRLLFQFDRTYAHGETAEIEVKYHGKPNGGLLFEKNRYGRRVVFAENWPNKAHHWFPSIDHPSDKATVSFAVTAPNQYEVVANGVLKKTVLLPYRRKLTQWEERQEIPTYCMVVGIGEFATLRSEKDGLPMAWYVYPQDSEKAAAKFRRTSQIIGYFESLIGPFPYEKLAQVESNIRLGAMENSDTIFYGEALFKSSSEEPVAHELAHQWFGDSVTESDWDHVWLSEGFATYLEALFYEQVNGPESLAQSMSRYATKIQSFKQSMEAPVIDHVQTDPLKKLTPITYEKGAWILHMLRGMMGDKAFFAGIRRFYELHAGGNVRTEDFQRSMELAARMDLSRFFQQWLYKPGWPEYRISWQWDRATGNLDIYVEQTQTHGLFDMPADIRISTGDHSETHSFRIYEPAHTFRLQMLNRPTAVEFDPENRILKTIVP